MPENRNPFLAKKVIPKEIEEEMKSSYIDYAMSVIVGRALPDVRDGLKPVHRRILYAMYDMGMTPGRPHKKCARIVGEVLGKYHPHGDMAVYDSLVRMAQDFSCRYELIDGHGNFGSVDGDSPAAMRYTEARLSSLAMELLRDIDKNTVDFTPNFDDTLTEPAVLPSRFPNLLVNGSSGIAVGMATNIPPHNLREVIDGIIMTIDKPGVTTGELMRAIKGPDFPTGGVIMGRKGIRDAYETGRGSIRVRGKAHVEQVKGERTRIVITEIPFQVNKARLAEKIAELVRERKLQEVIDLRDESDRSGMRLVLELKREAIPQVVLNRLHKHTQLEVTFGVIMLALVNGVPRTLNLVEIIRHYIEHQREVVIRRTRFELDKAETRAHILEGLLVALKNLDEVIRIIRRSKTAEQAKKRLIQKFKLSPEQSQAILDMRLQRLVALEREKIETEHKELLAKIEHLKGILADERGVLELIKKELQEIRKSHSDERRTQISSVAPQLSIEDLIAEEEMAVTITHSGYVKRLPVATYRKQHRGGKGVLGMNLKEGDFVEHLFISSTHHYVLFFSNKGKVYRLKVHELPLGSRTSKGQAIVNILPFRTDEMIAAVIATREFDENRYVIMATKRGLVKKTRLKEYDTTRRDGIIAIILRGEDELISVKLTKGEEDAILVTRHGQAIRFSEKDVRPMGRASSGVRGIRLKPGDEVLGMDIAIKDADLFVVTEAGFGKRTPIFKYPRQGRGGKGTKTLKTVSTRGKLAGVKVVKEDHELMLVSSEGNVIRVPTRGIPRRGRNTQGVKIMNLGGEDKVSALAKVVVSKEKKRGK
ncbi:MAG: DNA gyrase subunit A [Actinomycetota bacterium]|nr:DNA gyrase subunit A [Actinomycetota bacterium]